MARDNRRCVRCGRTGMLSVHHLRPRWQHGSNRLENLVTLCDPCHDWVESNLSDHLELQTRAGIIGSYPWPERAVEVKTTLVGEQRPGDKADIWVLWVKNGRKDAARLVKRYGEQVKRTRNANGRPLLR